MSFANFVARRIIFSPIKGATSLAVKFAAFSLALGLAASMVAISVEKGFSKEIRRKIADFSGDFRIVSYSHALFNLDETDQKKVFKERPYVQSLTPYIETSLLIKSGGSGAIEGIVARGTPSLAGLEFVKTGLLRGKIPDFKADSVYSKEIIVSEKLARLLEVDTADQVKLYVSDADRVKVRIAVIRGIFRTGLAEYDRNYILCDSRLVYKLHGVKDEVYDGVEVRLKPNYAATPQTRIELDKSIPYNTRCVNSESLFPDLYAWLDLQSQNVTVIVGLMLIVGLINMASATIMLITERAKLITTLRAIGASANAVSGVFMRQTLFLTVVGLILGNLLGFGILFLQDEFKLIKLDSDNYFVQTVPISFEPLAFLYLDIGALAVIFISSFLPLSIIRRMRITSGLKT